MKWRLLRSLMNVRPPMPVSEEFLQIQDAFLKEMTEEKGIVDANGLPPCARDCHPDREEIPAERDLHTTGDLQCVQRQ